MNEQLRRAAVRGVGWSLFSTIFARIFQIAASLILAKLLVPADFGVFALASMIVNALAIFPGTGFAQVLIYQQGDIRRSANTAFILSAGTGALFSAILFVSAPTIGKAFNEPSLTWPLRVLGSTLIFSGSAAVPFALLDKWMMFQKRMIAEVTGAVVYTLVSIVLAMIGYGVWSLVTGWTAMILTDVSISWIVSPWRPRIQFDTEESRAIIAYGKHLVIGVLAAFIFVQIDKAAVGKWLGMTELGYYSIAFTICNLTATNLTQVINRVMFPAYSKMQDISGTREMYLRMLRHLSVAAFPSMAGIIVISGPLIEVLYGHKWSQSIPLFHILAFYGLIRAIGMTSDAVFLSADKSILMRKMNTIQLIIGGLLVIPAAKIFGTAGVAILFTLAIFAGTFYGLSGVKCLLSIRVSEILGIIWRPLTAALAAGLVAFIFAGEAKWINIFLILIISTAIYGMTMLLLDRAIFYDIAKLLRKPEPIPEEISSADISTGRRV